MQRDEQFWGKTVSSFLELLGRMFWRWLEIDLELGREVRARARDLQVILF